MLFAPQWMKDCPWLILPAVDCSEPCEEIFHQDVKQITLILSRIPFGRVPASSPLLPLQKSFEQCSWWPSTWNILFCISCLNTLSVDSFTPERSNEIDYYRVNHLIKCHQKPWRGSSSCNNEQQRICLNLHKEETTLKLRENFVIQKCVVS